MSADGLIAYIRKVKQSSTVPVTTGEGWDVWIAHPELVSAVDFIAAHVLPYWGGVDAARAVDSTTFNPKSRTRTWLDWRCWRGL
jgi:exo-beta-1,3-glucanase (GH17 family)